ncbi:hypothetical protein C499_19595 [Halogeometricum borinquense DSM 11551]|uniref:Uncharacterized protein n=1 Tax=Halogeometricum borinquense (strain ATCC 700274 / DSM 11551 / JCM 10706 / KCTC 4070 / PR3) TaxID=469382 RepID=E4NWU0_HALBP|nr:AbrB/MazE/SpoVT family DNA-binding domain-containing protein [Halogeometricum borinquense]ADQ69510.1 hypothetical protein Hbor_38050 [Halogeometricum borinquense DSM 11551]ELY23059.1 hypothetical protein C499_19595 [Halogeometricum borinquense DSM 11551]
MQEHWSRRGYLGSVAGLAGALAGVSNSDRDREEDDADAQTPGLQTITLRIPKEVADDLDVEAGDSVLYQGTN